MPPCLQQVPDEQDVLKRRVKAEQRKQQHAAALTILEPTAAADSNASAALSKAATGTLKDTFTPVTLVLKDVRYFVPNPAYSASKNKDKGGSGRSSKVGHAAKEESLVTAAKPIELSYASTAVADSGSEGRSYGSSGSEGVAAAGEKASAEGVAHIYDSEHPVVVVVQQHPSTAEDAQEVPQELELLKGGLVCCFNSITCCC